MNLVQNIRNAFQHMRDNNVPAEPTLIPLLPNEYDFLEKHGYEMKFFFKMGMIPIDKKELPKIGDCLMPLSCSWPLCNCVKND